MKLFHHKKQNTIYKGTKESASPFRDTKPNVTFAEARAIDLQDRQIRDLEKQAQKNAMLRFYMKGF